jgi:hypothetical protein
MKKRNRANRKKKRNRAKQKEKKEIEIEKNTHTHSPPPSTLPFTDPGGMVHDPFELFVQRQFARMFEFNPLRPMLPACADH